MRLSNEELTGLYQQDTARTKRERTECLTSELLVRAAAGELDPSEREMMADHMISCADCAAEYRGLLPLRAWADAAATSVSEARPEPKLASIPLSGPSSIHGLERTITARSSIHDFFFSFRVPYAVAALLMVLSLALIAALIAQRRVNQSLVARLNERRPEGVPGTVAHSPDSNGELRRQLDEATRRAEREAVARAAAQEELARRQSQQNTRENSSQPNGTQTQIAELRATVNSLSRPQVNVPIVDLDPQGSTRAQSPGALTTIDVPSGAKLFTLILNITGEPSHPGYAMEISNQRGMTVWRGSGLRKSPYNNFTVALPRRSFPAGQYRIKLYGLRDGTKELVEEYAVRVQYR